MSNYVFSLSVFRNIKIELFHQKELTLRPAFLIILILIISNQNVSVNVLAFDSLSLTLPVIVSHMAN